MKTYWVYILRFSDGSYYTGKTSNIEKRFNEHHSGIYRGYTFLRRPLELIYPQKFINEIEANEAERRIKSWSRKKKEALIEKNFALLHDLSICKNETHYINKSSL